MTIPKPEGLKHVPDCSCFKRDPLLARDCKVIAAKAHVATYMDALQLGLCKQGVEFLISAVIAQTLTLMIMPDEDDKRHAKQHGRIDFEKHLPELMSYYDKLKPAVEEILLSAGTYDNTFASAEQRKQQ